MQKHYLDAPNAIDEKERRIVPDRSNLAKLYPGVGSHLNSRLVIDSIPLGSQPKRKSTFFFVLIGILLPLPLLVGKTVLEFFLANTHASDIFFMLPGIVVSIVLWVGLLALSYLKLSKQFYKRDLNSTAFLTYQLSCLALVTPLLYSSTLQSHTVVLSQAVFGAAFIAVSALLAYIQLSLAANEKTPRKTKVFVLSCLLFICALSALIYLIQMLT